MNKRGTATIKPLAVVACALSICANPVQSQSPLSAIDWLNHVNTVPANVIPPTVLRETPVTKTALSPAVTVLPLQQQSPPIGLISSVITGLPYDLWQHSQPDNISRLVRNVPVRGLPAMQSLLMTLLLSDTRPPYGDSDTVLLARLDRLMELGAADPALALIQDAGPTQTPKRFVRWFNASLLTGHEDRSCAAVSAAPYLSTDYRVHIFCTLRRGDWPLAALTLDIAQTLDILPSRDSALFERLVHADNFEAAPALPFPRRPDPLTLRVFETIGEPLPTATLPRAFATADLRDIAGWKAQLEAAERLTRSGAMNPNLLLGLFTARSPAASGGIWDRVRAVQDMEQALNSGNKDAITSAVPPLWNAARSAGLETAIAELFAEDLAKYTLEGDAGLLAWHLCLLSSHYEISADEAASRTDRQTEFLAALAKGVPQNAIAETDLARAISLGFAANAVLSAQQRTLIRDRRLGEIILQAMAKFSQGANGDLNALSQSLATLRQLGLEDTARRAALQLILLGKT